MTLDVVSVGLVNARGRGPDRLAAALKAPVPERTSGRCRVWG
jgi:hypothetical protein